MTNDTTKTIGDALSGTVVIATVIKWLPALAALLSIAWTSIRIYEYIVKKLRKEDYGIPPE